MVLPILKQGSDNTAIIAGSSVSGVVLVAGGTVTVAWFIKRWKKLRLVQDRTTKASPSKPEANQTDNEKSKNSVDRKSGKQANVSKIV